MLRKEWNKTKKKAMVIIINPSSADIVLIDYTTMYVVNNLSEIGFGSVDIVSIFSKIDIKISIKEGGEGLADEENDIEILNAIEDEKGNVNFHPLASQIRYSWKLKKL